MEKNEENGLLKPKNDVVFHALFREENKNILANMLSTILEEEVKIKSIDKDRYVEIKEAEDKLGIMDLRAELSNGDQCNIEVQLDYLEYENERILYYWANTYYRQLERGELYGKLHKTISVIIVDHEIKELKGIEKLGTKWQIRDNENGKRVLTEKLEICIIELPKALRIYKENPKNKISQWMVFMDDPNKKEVIQIMEENKNIEEAVKELKEVSGDKELRRIAELREKGRRDMMAMKSYAERTGREKGMEEGRKEGREKGIEEGREEGRNKIKEIAKKLLNKGVDIEEIEEITELTEEEIKKLQ